MKKLLALLLLFGCATVRREASFTIGATAMDLGTTFIGRQRGASEVNPLMRNEVAMVAVNAAIVYGALKLSEHFRSLGYSNWYLPLRILSAVHLGSGAWNLTQMERR